MCVCVCVCVCVMEIEKNYTVYMYTHKEKAVLGVYLSLSCTPHTHVYTVAHTNMINWAELLFPICCYKDGAESSGNS